MKAQLGHYSSVVGLSIHIVNDDGAMLGQLGMIGFRANDREQLEHLGHELTEAINKGLQSKGD